MAGAKGGLSLGRVNDIPSRVKSATFETRQQGQTGLSRGTCPGLPGLYQFRAVFIERIQTILGKSKVFSGPKNDLSDWLGNCNDWVWQFDPQMLQSKGAQRICLGPRGVHNIS